MDSDATMPDNFITTNHKDDSSLSTSTKPKVAIPPPPPIPAHLNYALLSPQSTENQKTPSNSPSTVTSIFGTVSTNPTTSPDLSFETMESHICPNDKRYPTYEEIVRYGRLSAAQMKQIGPSFDNELYHCYSHYVCEAIYHISDHTSSLCPAIEDLIPMSRSEFDSRLKDSVTSALRTRLGISTASKSSTPDDSPVRNVKRRQFTVKSHDHDELSSSPEDNRLVRPQAPSPPARSSERSSASSPEDRLLAIERRIELQLSQIRSDHSMRSESIPETDVFTLPASTPFTPVPDSMSNCLRELNIPSIFADEKLSFLHQFHQCLYSLHHLDHVKLQSFPKDDIFSLIKFGYRVCTLREKQRKLIRNRHLFMRVMENTFDFRKRKVIGNHYDFPFIKNDDSITSSYMLDFCQSLQLEYSTIWKRTFGSDYLPPFA